MDGGIPTWMSDWRSSVATADIARGQRELFPLTLTAILPDCPLGQHLKFVGVVGGDRYYCKGDKNGSPLRATEWFFSSLANHLNIAVPDFAPIMDPRNKEVLFGSRGVWGTAQGVEVNTFLTTPQINDRAISAATPWLVSYLARLYAFDLFASNPDRQLVNFLMVPQGGARRLLAFDFASADLRKISSDIFDVADTPTLTLGRRLRSLHGFDLESALEMLDWIAAVSGSAIESIVDSMPADWLEGHEKGRLCENWSSGGHRNRIAALRSGLRDESLL